MPFQHRYIRGDRATGRTQKLLILACDAIREGKEVLWMDFTRSAADSSWLRLLDMTKGDDLICTSQLDWKQASLRDQGMIEFTTVSNYPNLRGNRYQIFCFDNWDKYARDAQEGLRHMVNYSYYGEIAYYVIEVKK